MYTKNIAIFFLTISSIISSKLISMESELYCVLESKRSILDLREKQKSDIEELIKLKNSLKSIHSQYQLEQQILTTYNTILQSYPPFLARLNNRKEMIEANILEQQITQSAKNLNYQKMTYFKEFFEPLDKQTIEFIEGDLLNNPTNTENGGLSNIVKILELAQRDQALYEQEKHMLLLNAKENYASTLDQLEYRFFLTDPELVKQKLENDIKKLKTEINLILYETNALADFEEFMESTIWLSKENIEGEDNQSETEDLENESYENDSEIELMNDND